MSIRKSAILFGVALSMAAFMGGCSSDTKDGSTADVAKVDEASCAQCHGSAREKMTGRVIYDDYAQSIHLVKGVGCQDCHGGGAQHNGVGPIPVPKPSHIQCAVCHDGDKLVTTFLTSKHANVAMEEAAICNRCHSHQGAVLSTILGFTGDGTVMDAGVNAPSAISAADWQPIKCITCHLTHKPNELRVDPNWAPSSVAGAATNNGSSQYKLCTQCHTYINPAGSVAGSGTTASGTVRVGHHETSWYRAIATTHYDNPATAVVEGYGVRTTGNACFDCHGHESKTNSNNIPGSSSYNAANTTIYTDWAQSGHALGLLKAKYAAATANPVNTSLPRTSPVRVAQGLAQVDAVMAANVPAGPFGGHNSGSCARCHTTEGFAYTMNNLANTPVAVSAGMLKCFGCHTNPGAGTLRTLKGTKATTNYTTDLGWNPTSFGYALNYGKKAYPDVAASNLCVSCHDSRQNDPGAITTATTAYTRTHYLQAAATMYVKMGFLNLSTGSQGFANVSSSAAYKKTLMSDQDGGSVTSTHRKLGTPAMIGDHGITAADTVLLSNGPCVACHMAAGSHTLAIDQKAITTVCNKCHDSEGGHAITTIADFNTYFIEPQSEVYQDALNLAIAIFNAKNLGVTIAPESAGSPFVRPFITNTTTEANAANLTAVGSSWTAIAAAGGYNRTKLLGAIGNIILFKNDPGGYAHARTYSRRLLYDTIDFLDNGRLDMTVSATAMAMQPTVYGKGASAFTDGTLTTLTTGTTEAMTYLIKWSRTNGAWSSPERP